MSHNKGFVSEILKEAKNSENHIFRRKIFRVFSLFQNVIFQLAQA